MRGNALLAMSVYPSMPKERSFKKNKIVIITYKKRGCQWYFAIVSELSFVCCSDTAD